VVTFSTGFPQAVGCGKTMMLWRLGPDWWFIHTKKTENKPLFFSSKPS
jgi:hypothetical protein